MTLTEFQRTSYRLFGGVVSRSSGIPKLEEELRRARMGMRAEAYMASALAQAAIAAGVGLMFGLFIFLVIVPVAMPNAPKALMVFLPIVPLIMGGMTYAVMLSAPATRAKQRGKDIELRIPYALNYIAAMASAGVNVDQVFRSLSEQKIYGECAKEAEGIYRDMAYFGKDSVTAMKRAIARSPSDKWQEFLQGAITTVTSGGNLQMYFSAKAQRYMWENRNNQKQYVEMMGLMAETYVTACVAGPLFLIVMMAIMGMLGGQGAQPLFLVVYLMLPVANAGFTYALHAMTPEV